MLFYIQLQPTPLELCLINVGGKNVFVLDSLGIL